MAASRDPVASDGKPWSFCFINDSDEALESVHFEQVGCEWGDLGNSEEPAIDLGAFAPGSFREIWRDSDDAAEFRMWFYIRVSRGGETRRLLFEFPKLYLVREFAPIPRVGNRGVLSRAQAA